MQFFLQFLYMYKKGYIYFPWQNILSADFISVKEEENGNQLCSSLFEVQCNKAKIVLLKWTHFCINLASHSGSVFKVFFFLCGALMQTFEIYRTAI